MKAGQNLKVNGNQNQKVKGAQSRDNGKGTKKTRTPAKYVAPGSLGRRVPNRPTSFST
ncbi:unnamed protein product, partial [Linum tenue]